MKKEDLFNAIGDVSEQKIETAQSRMSDEIKKPKLKWGTRLKLCAAAAALSGITVFAANSPRTERIADSMMHWSSHDSATEQEKAIYDKYTDEKAFILETANGKFLIDGILYDQSILCIPYTYYPNTPLGEPGTDSHKNSLLIDSRLAFRIRSEADAGMENEPPLARHNNERFLGQCGYTDTIIQEDGSLKGNIIVSAGDQPFTYGQVIECCIRPAESFKKIRKIEDGEDCSGLFVMVDGASNCRYEYEYIAPTYLYAFTLDKSFETADIKADGIALPGALAIEDMSISSISLHMNGHFIADVEAVSSKECDTVQNQFMAMCMDSAIIMNDGSLVKSGNTQCHYHFSRDGGWTFSITLMFEAPIDLNNMQYLHMEGPLADNENVDILIPIR